MVLCVGCCWCLGLSTCRSESYTMSSCAPGVCSGVTKCLALGYLRPSVSMHARKIFVEHCQGFAERFYCSEGRII